MSAKYTNGGTNTIWLIRQFSFISAVHFTILSCHRCKPLVFVRGKWQVHPPSPNGSNERYEGNYNLMTQINVVLMIAWRSRNYIWSLFEKRLFGWISNPSLPPLMTKRKVLDGSLLSILFYLFVVCVFLNENRVENKSIPLEVYGWNHVRNH